MTFKVAGSVVALAVWLVLRCAVDDRPCRTNALEVGVDVVHVHDQAAVQLAERERRREIFTSAMQPDASLAQADLAVHNGAVWGPVDAARRKTEHPHEVV